MKTPHLRTLVVLALFASVLPALAQTTTPPATCTTAPQPPTAFNIERAFVYTGITGTGSTTTPTSGTVSTITPTINPNILPALQSNALEPRQSFSLNPSTNVITITTFGAQPSSTSPTTPGNIQTSNVLSVSQFNVTQVFTSCNPVPSVIYVGNISPSFPADPFGSVQGSIGVIIVTYTTATPPAISSVQFIVPGRFNVYSFSGAGTITFPAGSTTPPGTTTAGPTIVFTPSQTQTVVQRQLVLDASRSTSSVAGATLSYSWRQVNSNISAAINQGNTATPLITFNGGKGDYIFEVTVSDGRGNTSTAQTTITYQGL